MKRIMKKVKKMTLSNPLLSKHEKNIMEIARRSLLRDILNHGSWCRVVELAKKHKIASEYTEDELGCECSRCIK